MDYQLVAQGYIVKSKRLCCAWQVPLGHRFRHVLSEEEHFSPQRMVQQLQAKGVTVRAAMNNYIVSRDNLSIQICKMEVHGRGLLGTYLCSKASSAHAGGAAHGPDQHLEVLRARRDRRAEHLAPEGAALPRLAKFGFPMSTCMHGKSCSNQEATLAAAAVAAAGLAA